MATKTLPFTKTQIERIVERYPTPFHIYDAQAIVANARRLSRAFAWAPGFRNYFPVKALPNPHIVKLLADEGFGADCSSLPELVLAERVGLAGEQIMFSSNDTPAGEYVKAAQLGAVINLDDVSHIDFLERHAGLPDLLCFRYNPGPTRHGNAIIGEPAEAKFGITDAQVIDAYRTVRERGVTRFGMHTMVASNELGATYLIDTARMLFEQAVRLKDELGIRLEFVNLGGGWGIPYRPKDEAIDIESVAAGIRQAYQAEIVASGLDPLRVYLECGRLITGPYGYLVSTVLHKKDTYKQFVGLDACMANLMRPAIYGAYHHITVLGKENAPCDHVVDVTGSLCENNDKFAIDRALPVIEVGDVLVIHDTGAHGHALGFNYNGKLRSAELLLEADGAVRQIRRAETVDDYFATVDFEAFEAGS
jgi:diaminopimelate decarboxylase